jgi:hypothetical protein
MRGAPRAFGRASCSRAPRSGRSLRVTPFVGALTSALGFLLLAWSTPEDATFSASRLCLGKRSVSLHPRWVLLGCICAIVGAQIAWLAHIGIDVDLAAPPRHWLTPDTLTAGSPGNCGLPSQPACQAMALAQPRMAPALQALLWTTLLAPLLWSIARERRTRRLLLLAGWLCMGLATLAKGIAGFALPLTIAGTTLLLQRRWRELWRSELARGAMLLALLVLPWFVAASARHGRVIFDELVLRHMIGRTLEHLHDTNAGQDVGVSYYLWQLAYATFPWTGFVPAALAFACVRRADRPAGTQRALDLAGVWLVVVFSLFTFMRTKFHHYILPAVPAVAVLVGVYLADAGQLVRRFRYGSLIAAALALSGALLTARIGADFLRPISSGLPGAARFFHLLSYRYDRPWPSELDFKDTLVGVTCVLTLIQLGLGHERWARAARAAYAAVALAFAAWLGQRYLVALAPSFGQRHVIEAFQRDRTSPEEPLVAYQLNWKGENFYTGNRLAIFVTSAKRFRRYVRERRQTDPTLHVVLETRRLPALRAELGQVKSFDVLSEPSDSDKICVVRVRL